MLPHGLSEKQELQRQETINKVLRAANELQSQGCCINIKNIMSLTGLSRSVFSKPHVQDVLNQYFSDVREARGCEAISLKKQKRRNFKEEIGTMETQITKLRDENASLRAECALLRGKLFLLMQERNQ